MTRTKKPKAPWVTAFPKQATALRPENTQAGGVKARSDSQCRRMDVYRYIAFLYKSIHPLCEACRYIAAFDHGNPAASKITSDIHHRKGKVGLLLFDARYFLAVCRECHNWIGDHPKEAEQLGLNMKRA